MQESFLNRAERERFARCGFGFGKPGLIAENGGQVVQGSGHLRMVIAVKLPADRQRFARVPLQPRLTCSQNRSRPMPKGETTPMPVITMRSDISLYDIWSSGHWVI